MPRLLGQSKRQVQKNIRNSELGLVAPSFWETRTWENCSSTTTQGTKAQFMWFCNDSVDHTWQLCNTITHYPAKVPDTWPVERGKNLTNIEIKTLEDGGYKLAKKRAMAIRNM